MVWQRHYSLRFLNQLIFHPPFNTLSESNIPLCHCGIPWFTFCQFESTLSLRATYYHCNIYLTFWNRNYYLNITNKLQFSIKTIPRTDTHTHQHISHVSYITTHTYIHSLNKNKVIILYFSNWSIWWLIILTNTFLIPKGCAVA